MDSITKEEYLQLTKQVALLQRRLKREKSARVQVEQLVENKSRALYEANMQLKIANKGLEEKVVERTKELEKNITELNRANQELNEFAYIVSHDLKAPLRAIAQLLSFLEADIAPECLNDDVKMYMKLLKDRALRMENLINAILSYSRVGRINAEKTSLDVLELLADSMFFIEVPENFTISITGKCKNIFANRTQIQQVLQNLIDNAIKYNDKPHGIVKIMIEQKGDFSVISIKDNGPGIDEKYHQKIFQIFQSLQSRTSVNSTGIGLSIVKKTIETLDGTIHVESQLGEGTTFIVSLPSVSENK